MSETVVSKEQTSRLLYLPLSSATPSLPKSLAALSLQAALPLDVIVALGGGILLDSLRLAARLSVGCLQRLLLAQNPSEQAFLQGLAAKQIGQEFPDNNMVQIY